MTPRFSIFTPAIKFDCLVLAIFQSFYLIVIFNFDKLSPTPWIYILKDVLNHYSLDFSA